MPRVQRAGNLRLVMGVGRLDVKDCFEISVSGVGNSALTKWMLRCRRQVHSGLALRHIFIYSDLAGIQPRVATECDPEKLNGGDDPGTGVVCP